MKSINIAIVDDHRIFRDGLKLMFNKMENIHVILEAENGKIFLSKLPSYNPDLVFMDINMPELNGFDTTEQAIQLQPDIKIIALTSYEDHDFLNKMLHAGVYGYMLKNSDYIEFKEAIDKVLQKGYYFSDKILQNLAMDTVNKQKAKISEEKPKLSKREFEILQILCNGVSTIEIADKLHISKRTVEKHKNNMMEKTGTKSTVNLVIYAFKNHLVDYNQCSK